MNWEMAKSIKKTQFLYLGRGFDSSQLKKEGLNLFFIYSNTGVLSSKSFPEVRPVMDELQIDLHWLVVHLKAAFFSFAK